MDTPDQLAPDALEYATAYAEYVRLTELADLGDLTRHLAAATEPTPQFVAPPVGLALGR